MLACTPVSYGPAPNAHPSSLTCTRPTLQHITGALQHKAIFFGCEYSKSSMNRNVRDTHGHLMHVLGIASVREQTHILHKFREYYPNFHRTNLPTHSISSRNEQQCVYQFKRRFRWEGSSETSAWCQPRTDLHMVLYLHSSNRVCQGQWVFSDLKSMCKLMYIIYGWQHRNYATKIQRASRKSTSPLRSAHNNVLHPLK